MFEMIWLQLVACLQQKRSCHWNVPWNWFTTGCVQLCWNSSKFMKVGSWILFCMAHPFWTEFPVSRHCKSFSYMHGPRIKRQEHGIAEGFVLTMLELEMTLVESKEEIHHWYACATSLRLMIRTQLPWRSINTLPIWNLNVHHPMGSRE